MEPNATINPAKSDPTHFPPATDSYGGFPAKVTIGTRRSIDLKRPRILVTDSHTSKSLAIVRALGRTMEVWTAADSRVAIAAWSRYSKKHIVYPRGVTERFCDWLIDCCRTHGVDIVITPEEWSSLQVARDAHRFEEAGILVTTPSLSALQIAVDKAETLQKAQAAGIPTPLTAVLERLDDAVSAASTLGYPLVIKPRTSRYWDGERQVSSGGVRYARSQADLETHLAHWPVGCPPPLLQEYISGKGLGVFMLLDGHGRVCAEFAHERLRDVRSTGAASVLRRSVRMDTVLRDRSLALLRACGWSGVAMIEFRTDAETGEAYLMEINGRFWGSLQLAIDAGVNFPRALVEMTLGREVLPAPYDEGAIVRWWLGDLLGTLRALKGRPRGYTGAMPARWAALSQFVGRQPAGTRNEVLRWDDPLPAVGELFCAMRRL